jgi:RNA polymerase sigma factor (sigma-70 family)
MLSRSAFDARTRPLYPALLAYAQRRLPPDDAADAVQQALLNAWTRLDIFQDTGDEGRFARWLLGILRHACLSLRDSNARRACHERPLPSADPDPDEETGDDTLPEIWWNALLAAPDEALCHAELIHEARYRLRHTELTPLQRHCLVQRLNGWTQARIAAGLGLSQQAVSRHLRNAITRLRRCPFSSDTCPTTADYLWRLGKQVTIYYRPPRTGAAIARQRQRRLR